MLLAISKLEFVDGTGSYNGGVKGSVASNHKLGHLQDEAGDTAEGSDEIHRGEHHPLMGNDVHFHSEVHLSEDLLGLWNCECVRTEELHVVEQVCSLLFRPPVVVSLEFVISISVTAVGVKP